jgi:aryl-alcohol dehydrogenase-like predicted oxidoreductase
VFFACGAQTSTDCQMLSNESLHLSTTVSGSTPEHSPRAAGSPLRRQTQHASGSAGFHPLDQKIIQMQQVTLKHTDLKVSRLCFGTMTFGKPVDQKTATAMVTRSIDAGINFFDTANIYQTGVSEEMTGNALAGRRDKVILASKVRGKMSDAPGDSGLSKRAMRKGIEDSLRRLKTDYLDLYYLHQPDYDAPIEETLETMDALLREGKVRYPATSNYSGWQVVEMIKLAEQKGYKPAYISQPMYNLLARGIEQEYLPMCLQSARRRHADRQAQAAGGSPGHSLRQEQDVSRSLLARRKLSRGGATERSGGEGRTLAHQSVVRMAAPSHRD